MHTRTPQTHTTGPLACCANYRLMRPGCWRWQADQNIFDPQDWRFEDTLDWFIDVFFIMDVLLNFRTTYHIEETNEMVTSTGTISAIRGRTRAQKCVRLRHIRVRVTHARSYGTALGAA